MSALFRTRISSTTYKHYIEIRGQPGQSLLTDTGKVWSVAQGQNC